jgi:hypothetical protein
LKLTKKEVWNEIKEKVILTQSRHKKSYESAERRGYKTRFSTTQVGTAKIVFKLMKIGEEELAKKLAGKTTTTDLLAILYRNDSTPKEIKDIIYDGAIKYRYRITGLPTPEIIGEKEGLILYIFKTIKKNKLSTIEIIENSKILTTQPYSSYNSLVRKGYLTKEKIGRNTYYTITNKAKKYNKENR